MRFMRIFEIYSIYSWINLINKLYSYILNYEFSFWTARWSCVCVCVWALFSLSLCDCYFIFHIRLSSFFSFISSDPTAGYEHFKHCTWDISTLLPAISWENSRTFTVCCNLVSRSEGPFPGEHWEHSALLCLLYLTNALLSCEWLPNSTLWFIWWFISIDSLILWAVGDIISACETE